MDFLESHPDYGMCYTKAKIWEKGAINGVLGTSDTSFAGLIRCNNFPTLTKMCRKSVYEQYVDDIKPGEKKWLMGDYPMAFYFTVNSKVGFIDECSAVYRVLPESASHSDNLDYLFRFYDSAVEISHFFVDRYISDKTERNRYLKQIKEQAIKYKISQYLYLKKPKEARRFYFSNRSDLDGFSRMIYNTLYVWPRQGKDIYHITLRTGIVRPET